MRDFSEDPIINNSGKITINHPSTITDGAIAKTNVNPSKVYGYNPKTDVGTNYGLATDLAALNPNPSSVYVDPADLASGQSWGGLMSGFVFSQ